MSQENVDLVKSIQPSGIELVGFFDELPAPGAALGDAFADDLDVRFFTGVPGHTAPGWRGLEGLARGWQDWLEPWKSYYLEAEDFIEAGPDKVIVLVRVKGRTARDGVAVEHSPAAIWTFRDDKVIGLHFYLERDEALRAAGLRTADRGASP
jgi:ketosteroid isomerase-like protein